MNQQHNSSGTKTKPLSKTRMENKEYLAVDHDVGDTLNARSAKNPTRSLRDFLYLVFKRKILIFSFFVAVVLTVALSTFLTSPVYRGKVQILVKMDRQNLYVHNMNSMKPASEIQINAEIEILKSRSLTEKTLLALGPAVVYPELGGRDQGALQNFIQKIDDAMRGIKKVAHKLAIKLFPSRPKSYKANAMQDAEVLAALPLFQSALSVKGLKDSNLINVSFAHEDPYMSAAVTNTLADIYLDHHLAIHKMSHSYSFFKEQTRLLQKKLQQSQQDLKAFKDQHEVISLDEERSLALRGMAELRTNLNQTTSLEVETKKRIRQLRQQLATTPATIAQGEVINQNQDLISQLESRIVELEVEIRDQDRRTKYTNRNRLVKDVEYEISMLRKKLAEHEKKSYGSKRSGTNPTHQRLQEELFRYEADLKAFTAKALAQKSQLNDYQNRLNKLNGIEAELNYHQEAVDVDKQNYRLYQTKFEESRISNEMDSVKIAGVSLVEAAHPPLKSTNRNFKLNILLAAVLGLFGGLCLAFLIEYLGNDLETVEDVEECLKLPVLASIPELKL